MIARYTFRGKHIGSGEWQYGFLVMPRHSLPKIYVQQIDTPGFAADYFVIDAATVGQCTGLKDNAGTTLYEGDIIEVNHEEQLVVDAGFVGIVRFAKYQHIGAQIEYPNGDLGFFIEWSGERKYRLRNDILYWTENEYVKKIGNEHDNPELIKEGGDNCDE